MDSHRLAFYEAGCADMVMDGETAGESGYLAAGTVIG